MPELADVIDRVQAAYGHACFACGRDNPIGMHLELLGVSDGWVEATFTPRPDFRGAPDVVHGGVTAAALDEILVWAGIVMENVMTVTGRLDLRYRRPIHLGETVIARGRVDSRSGRRLTISGNLMVGGHVAAEATGLYLVSASVDELPPVDRAE